MSESSESEKAAFVAGMREGVGSTGSRIDARDAVNPAMIRHWCDAMEDHNPVYTDPEFAAKSIHGELVAPLRCSRRG